MTLNTDNMILRGCKLKNTEYVLGLSVYTGHETKIMMNSKNFKFKMSAIQKGTNKQIVFVVCLQLALCVFASTYGTIWNYELFDNMINKPGFT